MFTPSHIASAHLLSQLPVVFGMPLSSSEVLTVIVAGNLVDLDFIVGVFLGKNGDEHHNFISHTPFFVVLSWLGCLFLFSQVFSFFVWGMILISAVLHLVLDDSGYWFCRLGWQEISQYPQINWLFPFKQMVKRTYSGTHASLVKNYFSKARASVVAEMLLCLGALVLFWYQSFKN